MKNSYIKSDILIKISQNLLLFSILFLFYNMKLLKICNLIKVKINSLKFINNMNLLTYKKIIENNYR